MSYVLDAGIEGKYRVFFMIGDRVAIVDAGIPGCEHDILRALRKAGIPQEKVSVLIATHAHFDHYGSLAKLKQTLKVPVIAGYPDAEYIERGENAPVMFLPVKGELSRAPGPRIEAVKVDAIARDTMSLRGYGIDALIVMTPGHTAGSVSTIASDGGCVTGDFLNSIYSGETAIIKQSIKNLADNGAKRFYPAHSGPVEASAVFEIAKTL